MSQFARMSLSLIRNLKALPPCARELHQYLLVHYPAGRVQEVILEPYAELCGCSLKYVRSCLKLLIKSGLVDLVRRYSASAFKLVAHDDRTFDFATGKKFVQESDKSLQKGNFCRQKEASKADSVVTKNREILRDNKDKPTHHPVQRARAGQEGALVVSKAPEGKAVSKHSNPEPPNPEPLSPEPLNPGFRQELEATLQQPLNKNILAVLLRYSQSRARDALDSLQEAIANGTVKSPAGFFVTALRKGFTPNHNTPNHNTNTPNHHHRSQPAASPPSPPEPPKPELPDGFRVWFELAFKAGVALGSEQKPDGDIIIYGPDRAEPFEQAQQTWPTRKLQELLAISPRPSVAPQRLESPQQSSERPERAPERPQRPQLPPESPKKNRPLSHPIPSEAAIACPERRSSALARLQAKWQGLLPGSRELAIAEAKLWDFEVTEAGIFEVAF